MVQIKEMSEEELQRALRICRYESSSICR